MKLSELPNIGERVEAQLKEVGIDTPEELRAAGAREAWLRILDIDPSACIHRLYALEGAVRGLPKARLEESVKAELRAFYRQVKN